MDINVLIYMIFMSKKTAPAAVKTGQGHLCLQDALPFLDKGSILILCSILFICSCLNLFVLDISRSLFIACEFIGEVSAAPGHRPKVCGITVNLKHWNICFDHGVSFMVRIHTKYTSPAFVQIAHYITGIFVRHSNLHGIRWAPEEPETHP